MRLVRCLVLLLLAHGLHALADTSGKVLVMAPDSPFAEEVLALLDAALDDHYTIDFFPLSDDAAQPAPRSVPVERLATADVVITLGDDAYRHYQYTVKPVLSAGESKPTHIAAYLSYAALHQQPQDNSTLQLTAEPDPVAQLALLRTLFPERKRIGVLLSEENLWLRDYLQQYLHDSSSRLVFQTVNPASLSSELPRFLRKVDVLLALSDDHIFNASTARLLLLTSYRQGKPVVGPSEAFVRAGSTATAYITPQDAVEAIAQAVQSGPSPKQAVTGSGAPLLFPELFSVRLNEHVLRAYGVQMTEHEVKQQMMLKGALP